MFIKKKVHLAWLITFWSWGFLVGIIASYLVKSSFSPLFLATISLLITIISLISRCRLMILVMIMSGLIIGFIYNNLPCIRQSNIGNLIGDSVLVTAIVADDPSVSKNKITLNLTKITISINQTNKTINGKIWCQLKNVTKPIKRYSLVQIKGVLDGGFANYLAKINEAKLVKNINLNQSDFTGQIRDNFSNHLKKVLNERQVGLGMGLLAGQKTNLDDDVKKAFLAASLTHILVASGYNLTILTRFTRRFLAKKSRLLAILISVGLILLFASLTGPSASMNRAVTVSIICLITWYFGRSTHPLILLSIVSAFSLMIEPSQIMGDIGWYLSFTSFAGVIILAPLLTELVVSKTDKNQPIVNQLQNKYGKIGAAFVQVFIETSSAQLLTWPIIAFITSNVSLVGLVTNLIVLPVIPFVMLVTFLTGLMSFICLPLAHLSGWLTGLSLDYVLKSADFFASLPFAQINFQTNWFFVIIYYLVLIIIIYSLFRHTKYNFYSDNMIK